MVTRRSDELRMNALFEGIYGSNPYKSPTDMGVNMVGFCISDEKVRGQQRLLLLTAKMDGLCLPIHALNEPDE